MRESTRRRKEYYRRIGHRVLGEDPEFQAVWESQRRREEESWKNVHVRLTPDEHKRATEKAERLGISVSELFRRYCCQ